MVKNLMMIMLSLTVINGEYNIAENLYGIENRCEVNQQIEYLKEEIESSLKLLESVEGISSQNKVLQVKYNQGVYVVDLDGQAIGYTGGTYTEYLIGKYIMEAIFENTEANAVMILLDGKADAFKEGSDYSYCTRDTYTQYYKDGE